MSDDLEKIVETETPLGRAVKYVDKHKWKIGYGLLLYSGFSHYTDYLKDGTDAVGCAMHSISNLDLEKLSSCLNKYSYTAEASMHNNIIQDFYYIMKGAGELAWDCIGYSVSAVIGLALPKIIGDKLDLFKTGQARKRKHKKTESNIQAPFLETLFFGNQKRILRSNHYGSEGDYGKAVGLLREAEGKDPNNWGIAAGIAMYENLIYGDTERNRDSMISSNYKCFRMMEQRSVPLFKPDLKAIQFFQRIKTEAKKKGVLSERNRGYEIAQGIWRTMYGNYEGAIENFTEALNFPVIYTKQETNFEKFVTDVVIDGRTIRSVDERGYKLHLLEMQRNDNALAMVIATALNAISAQSSTYSSKATEGAKKAYLEVFLRSREDLRSKPVRLGESKNLTYVFSGVKEIEEDLVFKENPKREALEGEVRVAHEIEKIIREYPKLDVEEPIGVFEFEENKEKKNVYIIKRVKGETLQEVIDADQDGSRTKEIVPRVGEYLALLHIGMKPYSTGFDPAADLERRLIQMNVYPETRTRIRRNHGPFTESLKGIPMVFNKDGHDENWEISRDDIITAIDCEEKEAIPCVYDLVNLLEGTTKISQTVKDATLNQYLQTLNKSLKQKIEHDNLKLAYLNAIYDRSLARSSSWQIGQRKLAQIPVMIDKMCSAILQIKEEFPKYFHKHEKQYTESLEAVRNIKVDE